jgi:FixJ family two-component response regulator
MSEGRVVAIVDDDDAVRQGVDSLLRSAGLPVVAFASAEDLIGSRHLWTIGCLILDLWMPGMRDLELQRQT